LLISASNDQTARVWDFASGETKAELRGHEHVVECAVFAPVSAYAAIRELGGMPAAPGTKAPGSFAATGSRDKTIRIWDTQSGQCLRELRGHDNWVRAIVFHPQGKHLLSASDDKTLRVWDLLTGRCLKTVDAHGHFVTCMAWGRATMGGAAEGDKAAAGKDEPRRINVIATGSVDQTIKVREGEYLHLLTARSGHHEGLRLHGHSFASGTATRPPRRRDHTESMPPH
jgi:platelet-activating factor acetylhydrolase IB subunit alpha